MYETRAGKKYEYDFLFTNEKACIDGAIAEGQHFESRKRGVHIQYKGWKANDDQSLN